jgi:hypothetical protein
MSNLAADGDHVVVSKLAVAEGVEVAEVMKQGQQSFSFFIDCSGGTKAWCGKRGLPTYIMTAFLRRLT